MSPRAFFWATGALSSVLDNAPTYLVFFKAAQALPADGPTMAGVDAARLAGVSLGAVFLGSMTYIGNGPNFMVKAIAEQAGVRMPSFFGYCLYSLGVLLPVFVLVRPVVRDSTGVPVGEPAAEPVVAARFTDRQVSPPRTGVLRLVAFWLFATAPLAWGLWATIRQAALLFG